MVYWNKHKKNDLGYGVFMGTKIYLCSVEVPGGYGSIAGLEQRLSAGRRGKIKSRRFEKDKLQALGAGLLLDFGLKEYGLREAGVAMAYGSNGKPYLADYPDIHFNLSHSGSMAMAVFSDREAGCDVERVQEARMSVARRFFTEEEYVLLESLKAEAERDRMFARIWTVKESFLKVTGEGMRMPLDSFSVRLDGDRPQVRLVGRDGRRDLAAGGGKLREDVSPPGGGKPREEAALTDRDGVLTEYTFHEFSVPGYQAAACIKGGEADGGDVFFSFQNLQDVV